MYDIWNLKQQTFFGTANNEPDILIISNGRQTFCNAFKIFKGRHEFLKRTYLAIKNKFHLLFLIIFFLHLKN